MYCTECGQLTREDMFGNLVHDYQISDAHTPIVEGHNGA